MPTALVVERDAVLRNIVRSVLTAQGFETMDAANAEEAVALCDLLRDLDLLIAGHTLAGPEDLIGSCVAEQLRMLAPQVKVLVISDCPYQVVFDQKGIPEGAWFLQKPFTEAQFLNTVKQILEPRIQ